MRHTFVLTRTRRCASAGQRRGRVLEGWVGRGGANSASQSAKTTVSCVLRPRYTNPLFLKLPSVYGSDISFARTRNGSLTKAFGESHYSMVDRPRQNSIDGFRRRTSQILSYFRPSSDRVRGSIGNSSLCDAVGEPSRPPTPRAPRAVCWIHFNQAIFRLIRAIDDCNTHPTSDGNRGIPKDPHEDLRASLPRSISRPSRHSTNTA